MLRTFQPTSTFNDLDDWEFAKLADHLGGCGRRVSTRAELQQALADAVRNTDQFQLIEIMLPRGVLSQTLARFAAGIKRLQAGKVEQA